MTYRSAKSYIRKNFTEGIYSGDNPYLSNVSIESMIVRWHMNGDLSESDYIRLRYEFVK